MVLWPDIVTWRDIIAIMMIFDDFVSSWVKQGSINTSIHSLNTLINNSFDSDVYIMLDLQNDVSQSIFAQIRPSKDQIDHIKQYFQPL